MLDRSPAASKPPQGLDAMWHRAIGMAGGLVKNRKSFLRQADRISCMEKQFRHVSERKLKDHIEGLQDRFRIGRDTVEDRDRAFAVIREVAARQIGLRPFPVQIAGALTLDAGCIAEMATGEGKTLVATMLAVLAGWRNLGCHVVTANDYLASRDAGLMKPIYEFCNLQVGCIDPDMLPADRKQAYDAQITYCTNKEVVADFLRDRLTLGQIQGLPSALVARIAGDGDSRIDRLVQRGLYCAIVDEADSIFIDEAITPLIISGKGSDPDRVEAFTQAAHLAAKLDPASDYKMDRRHIDVSLTRTGEQRLAEMAESLGGLWAGSRRREELVLQALAAQEFYIRGKQYVINDDRVVIVDEFTGRLMPDRPWRDGLHQAIEAKEGLDINLPVETYARISFQKFFRPYHKLSGMTGTGSEAQRELWQTYQLPVIRIPTNRPCRRKVMPDRIFTDMDAKWNAIVEEVCNVHGTERPVLIGTRSVQASEHLSDLLSEKGLEHLVLNAVRQEFEAQILACAGQRGSITVATNMAGRGTDIRLGEGIADRGGLHVIATERHESSRIDRQLFGRCARQGDPGSARTFTSLDDELIQKHANPVLAALARRSGRDGHEITSAFTRRVVDGAQQQAEKLSFRQRRELMRSDNWLDEHLGFTRKDF